MNNVLLISEDYIKTHTSLGDNLTAGYLLPTIKLAQDINLQNVIGTKLYDRLRELVDSGDITTEIDYKHLLDVYIQPFLAYSVVSMVTLPAAFKITNAGVVRTEDEKMSNVSLSDVNLIKEYYNKYANYYKNLLQKYLLDYQSIYPELNRADLKDIESNLRSTADTSIWLGGARGKSTDLPTRLRDKYKD